MFRRRNYIFLAILIAGVYFGPGVIDEWRWRSEVRKSIQSQINAAPIIDQFKYPRGGHVWKVTDTHIYYAYASSSSERTEVWIACVDLNTKEKVWLKEFDHWRRYRFLDEGILLSWNDSEQKTGYIELLDSTTGEVFWEIAFEKQLAEVLPHPIDTDILFFRYVDNSIGSIRLSTEEILWEEEMKNHFSKNTSVRLGKIWVEQGLLEITSNKRSSNAHSIGPALLKIDSGDIHASLPSNVYRKKDGYYYYRDKVRFFRHIENLSLEKEIEAEEHLQQLEDSTTGLSYFANTDWDHLILQDLEGNIVFESDDRTGAYVELIGGLLIWTSKSRYIYNVYDMRSGKDWILSLGINYDSRFRGHIQTWGDYMLHTSDGNTLYCRSRQTGQIIWKYPLSKSTKRGHAYFIIRDDILYGISRNSLIIFDLNQINPSWETESV